MILMITIIALTISVFGLSVFKTKKAKLSLAYAIASCMLMSIGYSIGGVYLLGKADKVESMTEVSLDKVDNKGNYVVYDNLKGVYFYKEKEGQLLKEVSSENATVSERKRGEASNTVVRKRVAISNKFLRLIYKGSNYESKIVAEFKIEDGGLTIQQ